MRRFLVLGLLAVVAAGCKNTRKWKTTPDLYQIGCNVPNARVRVYDGNKKLLSECKAGETFSKFDEDGTVRVTADGYYEFDGPVSQLEYVAKKSWYARLRRKIPGDQGGP
jgi:hypothetical protein